MAELKDNVNHPSHYTTGSVECIDALKSATSGLTGIEAVCTANAIKYLWRWKHKNGAEDLKKAIWYIERLIQEITPIQADLIAKTEPHRETCRDRLQREHPERVDNSYFGWCRGCPEHYGYVEVSGSCGSPGGCRVCWDSPVETEAP